MVDLTNLSDDDMTRQLGRLAERLYAHVSDLSEGRSSAIDDASTILRTLVAHGKGDNVIGRVIRRFALDEPQVRVSQPVKRQRNILLAFGGLPIKDDKIPLTAYSTWVDSLALAKADLRRDYYSWAQFVTSYANTYGSHLSGSVPDVLSEARIHRVNADLDLGVYLLWSAATVTSSYLDGVLNQLGLPSVEPLPDPGFFVTSFDCTTDVSGEFEQMSCGLVASMSGPLLEFRGVTMGGRKRVWRVSSEPTPEGTPGFVFDHSELLN